MSVGATLQSERLRLGIDLESLSQHTCIRRQYLEAIEADQPEKCPGRFFYRSFVRQFADAVGLNPDEIEAGIREITLVPEIQTEAPGAAKFPLRSPDRILSASNHAQARRGGKLWGSSAALVFVIIACAVLYSRLSGHRAEHVQTVQKPVAVPAAVPVPAQVPVSAPVPANQPVSTATLPVAENVTVTVKATEKAWVSLVTEGEPAITATLEPGDEKTIAGKESVKLRTGNAGGIEVSLNGKPIGSIGRAGQVRTLIFTPQGFHIVQSSEEEAQRPEAPVDTAARLSRR